VRGTTKQPFAPRPHPPCLCNRDAVVAAARQMNDVRVDAGDTAGTAGVGNQRGNVSKPESVLIRHGTGAAPGAEQRVGVSELPFCPAAPGEGDG
jgi:hypothetical protein